MKTQIKKESTNEHSIYRRDMIFYLNLILDASEKAKDKNKYWGELNNVISICQDMKDILYKRLLTYKDYDNLDIYAYNLDERFGIRFDMKYFNFDGSRNNKLITIYDSEIQGYISSVQNLKDLFIQSKFIK
jgi:hypothetical protein